MLNLPNHPTTIWSLNFTQNHYEISYLFSLLSPQEQERCLALKTPSLQDAFTIRRGRLREILTQYQPHTSPQTWEFDTNAYGRPILKQYHPLSFNMTHTPTQAFCLTSPHTICGIDAETVSPVDINSSFFIHTLTSKEQHLIHSIPSSLHARAFTVFWCLKEAHLKALGVGLTSPMNTLEIPLTIQHLSHPTDIHIHNDTWSYHLYYRDPLHIVATALCTSVSSFQPIEFNIA
jgi:4'-phosphopantetheinyl transferase